MTDTNYPVASRSHISTSLDSLPAPLGVRGGGTG